MRWATPDDILCGAADGSGEVAMDRFETDATADANGDVHVHVGTPGVRVHLVVDAPAQQERVGSFAAVLDKIYGSSPDFPWQTPDGKEPVVGGES